MLKNFRRNLATSITVGMAMAMAIMGAHAMGAQAGSESAGPVVRPRQGQIEGLTAGEVEEFRGVPYAAPPIGDLRWRAPVPPKPYDSAWNATTFPAPWSPYVVS